MMLAPPAMQNSTTGGGANHHMPAMFMIAPYPGRPVPQSGGNNAANASGASPQNQNNNAGNQNQNQGGNKNQNNNPGSPPMMPCYVPCFIMPHPGANPTMMQQQNMGDPNAAPPQGGMMGGMGGMGLYQPQPNPHVLPHPAGFVPLPYPPQDGGMDGQHMHRMNGINAQMPGHVFLANGPHGHASPMGMMMPIHMQPEMDQSAKNDYQFNNGMKRGMHSTGVQVPRPNNYDGDETQRIAVRLRGLPYDASAQDVLQFFQGLSVDDKVVFMPNKRKSSAAPGAPVKRGWGEAWAFFQDEAQATLAMERRGQHVGSRWIELKQFTFADYAAEYTRASANSGSFDAPQNNGMSNNHAMMMDANFMTAQAQYPGWEIAGGRGNNNGHPTPPLRMNVPPHHQALHPLPLNSVAFGGGNAGQGKGRMGNQINNKRHGNNFNNNIAAVPHHQSNNGSPDSSQYNNNNNQQQQQQGYSQSGRGMGARGVQGPDNTNGNARGMQGSNNNDWDKAPVVTRPQPVVQPPAKILAQSSPQSDPQSPQPGSPLPSAHLLGSPCIGSPQTSPAMQPNIHSLATPLPLRSLRGARVVLVDEDGLVIPSTPATAPATAPAAVLHSTDPDAGFASLIAHDFKGKQPEWVQQWKISESTHTPTDSPPSNPTNTSALSA